MVLKNHRAAWAITSANQVGLYFGRIYKLFLYWWISLGLQNLVKREI